MTAPSNQSLAFVRVGGREYPSLGSQRCGCCVHPLRESIERQLVQGRSPGSVVASLPEAQPLTARQVGDHYRNHLPIQDAGVAMYREQQAEARGDLVAEGASHVVTALSFASRVVSTVDARLVAGEIEPSLTDGLKAAALLAPVEQDVDSDVDMDAINQGFMEYLRAITTVCSREQVQAIGAHLAANPVMKALWDRRRDAGVAQ